MLWDKLTKKLLDAANRNLSVQVSLSFAETNCNVLLVNVRQLQNWMAEHFVSERSPQHIRAQSLV